MVTDTYVGSLLDKLAQGEEIVWDYLPHHVEEGLVERAAVMQALKACLKIVAEQYAKNYRTAATDSTGKKYWGERYDEAQTAMRYVNSGLSVVFRGIMMKDARLI